ncbi:magnesium transporter [Limibacter armeniacum]|uniref:magnesium transporter n=1 Tax=Limibacter armeniacum TaxID=466084 RepID=UPI002FE5CF03
MTTAIQDRQSLIATMIQDKAWDKLEALLSKMPAIEVAEALQALEPRKALRVLSVFKMEAQASVFVDLPAKKQEELFNLLDKRRFSKIFQEMPSDKRADFYQSLTATEQAALMPFLSKAIRENVLELSAYPHDTAGGIMNTDFATIRLKMTVSQALEKVRRDAPSGKMLYYIYVVDEQKHLVGFVTLKRLVLAEPTQNVSEILHTEYIHSMITDDREEVARLIEKYDLVAIPILNEYDQLVGIVSHDDAMDVLRKEQSEDLQKIMGIRVADEEAGYLETPVMRHFSKRIVWLVALAAFGIISGLVLHQYEGLLNKLVVLAVYMPMLADTGGNAGSQSSTVVIQALSVGEVKFSHWFKVMLKEASISTMLAICLGVLAFAKVAFLSSATELPSELSLSYVAFVIAVAISLQVISSSIIGALLPLTVKRLGGDPAVVASPAITTIVDITGLMIYFGLASWLLL